VSSPATEGLPGLLHWTVAWILIPVIVLATSTEVLARYVFHTPLQWTEEVITFSLLLVFVGAIPYGIWRDAHVKVETLYEMFGPAMRRFSDALGSLCGAVFLGMLTVGAANEAIGMAQRGETAEMTGWPQWPFAAAVCAIAGYCTVWLLVMAAGGLLRREPK
jgi:TRAP-type C4-dicarboxylate transport system permease small subunit